MHLTSNVNFYPPFLRGNIPPTPPLEMVVDKRISWKWTVSAQANDKLHKNQEKGDTNG